MVNEPDTGHAFPHKQAFQKSFCRLRLIFLCFFLYLPQMLMYTWPYPSEPIPPVELKCYGITLCGKLDLIGNIYRIPGSSSSLSTIRTLRTMAVMSMLPSPLYRLFPFWLLFICPTRTIAHLCFSATDARLPGRLLILPALCISPSRDTANRPLIYLQSSLPYQPKAALRPFHSGLC